MAEGIKLYKHFVDQVEKMGKIKRAWFTTFNLDISFFEKYMLSALMGVSYVDLKSPYDYEALNINLVNDEESLDEEKMEVKVFYDYRALKVCGKPKQTSVHLHPIDIKQIKGLNPSLNFVDGVFHPKITLIETLAGEYWMMATSANLTFGGWAKNRESFFCEKVTDRHNARELREFFLNIISSIKDDGSNIIPPRIFGNTFPRETAKWHFFSSFNTGRFIDQINYSDAAISLRVWSPYFAEDLPELIETIQLEHFDSIEIIPAKNENQKIRITEVAYNDCIKDNTVSFKQDKLTFSASEAFVHAKLWLTPKAMAIGSWNMTKSGMNESLKATNNVEAGIIYQLSSGEYETIIDQHAVSNLKSPAHFNVEELNKEKEDILDPFTITVDLVADWDKMQLQLQNPSFSRLLKQVKEDDYIIIPGLGKQKIKILQAPIDFRSYSRIFLTDRFFEIESKTGDTLYKGYIREIGLASRPINSFGNIDDYLKGWVVEKPEDKQELHRLAYPVEEENGDELSANTRKILSGNDQNAWFTSFHAFECIINRINHTRTLYAVERKIELKRIGRVLPGSLSELRNHLENLMNVFREDKPQFLKSPIYLWFLIEKANYVFTCFNEEIKLQSECIRPLKNLKFSEILKEEEIKSIGKDNLEKWKNYIIKKMKSQAGENNS